MSRKESLSFGGLSIRSVIPNVITLLALVSGLTSVRFALREDWDMAVSAIIFAGVLDGLDGTVARLLKSTSRFGAELDSLSDNVAFGVAPAIVIFLYALGPLDRLGWAVALLFAVAMALRLARFNAGIDQEENLKQRLGYLTGIPAPAGAGLLMVPLLIDLTLGGTPVGAHAELVGLYTVALACLMVSTFPTFSLRLLRVRRDFFVPVMMVIAVIIAGLFVHTWVVLLVTAALYVVTLPVTWVAFHRRRRKKGF